MKARISDMFDYFPGNHELTEEIIYNYNPTSPEDKIPIFSGSADNIIPIGFIRNNAKNKSDKDIIYFQGPCLILTKDGSAGLLTYKNKEDGYFTINHHACVLKLKKNLDGIVDPEWFSFQYRKKFYQYVTSKSDNCVFSTDWFDRVLFDIPDYPIQISQRNKKREIMNLIKLIDSYIEFLIYISKKTKMKIDGDEAVIGKIFDIKGGNAGLTEEFIYNNQPKNDNEKISILSSATIDINLMGCISRNTKLNERNVKIFQGPCILVARNGYAGTMTFLEKEEFTTNDHAYVIKQRTEFEKNIDLRWFVYQYQELFYNLVTSKSDNATFSKEYVEKQKIILPDFPIQKKIGDKLRNIDRIVFRLNEMKKNMEFLYNNQIIT